MVTAITMKEDSKMNFLMVGGPEGDPGLNFVKG